MSIDRFQDKIRRLKNPAVIDFSITREQLPPHLLEEEGSFSAAYGRFCKELLTGLKDTVPAVRFSLSAFSLQGPMGVDMLLELLRFARQQGYYVLLDVPEALSQQAAQQAAEYLLMTERFCCDGVIVSAYIGSDGVKPYVARLKESGKTLFLVVRTANKTAPEFQDLLTGSRLVHTAVADLAGRLGQPLLGECGYCQVAAVGAASSADSLRVLRAKQKYTFLLLDGYDYPNANAKNCSYAFDKLGHGAAACAGSTVTAAWYYAQQAGREYVSLAVQAAERMKKNLLRYVTIL